MDKSGDPSPIDTTAGGIADVGTHSCGFVPSANLANGADAGACYMADGSCTEYGGALVPPGRNCRDAGGILDRNTNCQTSLPERLDFDTAPRRCLIAGQQRQQRQQRSRLR